MSGYYIGSDYAGLDTPNVSFYYGYEETVGDEENEERCFVAKIKGKEDWVIPFSELDCTDGFNCEECLLAGITKILAVHTLEIQ